MHVGAAQETQEGFRKRETQGQGHLRTTTQGAHLYKGLVSLVTGY